MMSRQPHSRVFAPRGLALATAVLAVLALAAPALAGPPWISIEFPANPHDRATRGATLLVHTYHHDRAIAFPLAGTAEGLVDGRRVSVRLDVERTSRDGVFAVRRQWPDDGTWVLVLTLNERGDNAASVLVGIGPDGQVSSARVASDVRDGWTIPRAVTRDEVEDALAAQATLARALHAATAERVSHGAEGHGIPARAALLGLAPVGLILLLRRARRQERRQP